MTGRKWFFHMLKTSIAQRRGRVFVASASVAIASAVVVGALGLSLGVRQKMGGELKAYGANIMVTPKEGLMDEESLSAISKVQGVEDASGQLYERVTASYGQASVEAELLGIDTARTSGWKVQGARPSLGEALVGVDIRDALKLSSGGVINLSLGGRQASIRVSGFVERGGPEDKAIIMELKDAQGLTGLEGKLGAVLVRGRADGLEPATRAISTALPGTVVKTLRQIALAEEAFLLKVELLMALVTAVVVVASGISVSSTMSATILERMKEIALMKAIGGTRRMVGRFFVTEAGVIGLMGGLAGFVLGVAAFEAVSKAAFGSYLGVPPYLIAVSLLTGLSIAVLASRFPMRPALREKPSLTLRGE